MIKLLKLLSVALLFSCYSTSEGTQSKNEFKILFVGNSLTYVNDLPNTISTLAKQDGITIITDMLAFPNYALEDHWNENKVQSLLSSNHYDYVIVQQGPSSQADGRSMLLEYGAKFSKLCVDQKSRLAFFMVWPSISNYHTFDGVIQNYTEAAKSSNAVLCPVGAKWKEYIDKTRDYSYYGQDGFHPSIKGTEFTAEVILKTICNDGIKK